jgi:hypothetical protein
MYIRSVEIIAIIEVYKVSVSILKSILVWNMKCLIVTYLVISADWLVQSTTVFLHATALASPWSCTHLPVRRCNVSFTSCFSCTTAP